MFLRSFKLFAATLMAALLSAACSTGGGDPAPAPTGLAVVAGETSATLTWNMVDGVEYWVFAAPTSLAPPTTATMQGWFGLPGSNVVLKVNSPYVFTGLLNGLSYSFSVNGRTNGGPGGPGAAAVVATPRLAGSSWSAGAAIAGSPVLRSITFGATVATTTTASVTTYVAAGDGGAMFSSADSVTWNPINYSTSARINGASHSSNYRVVGDKGLLLTSPDAVTWTAQASGTPQDLYAVASNLVNLNVAVGAGGTIITSPDDVTWTAVSNSATSNDLYAVAYTSYNSGTWIAVGAGGTVVTSADGMNWQRVNSNWQTDLRGVSYGITSLPTDTTVTSAFVAVGAFGTVLTSTDGVNWVAQTLPLDGALNAVTYGAQFVAVGAGGSIFTSGDAVNWTPAASGTGQDLYAIVRGLLSYSAVGDAGSNLLSK